MGEEEEEEEEEEAVEAEAEAAEEGREEEEEEEEEDRSTPKRHRWLCRPWLSTIRTMIRIVACLLGRGGREGGSGWVGERDPEEEEEEDVCVCFFWFSVFLSVCCDQC